MFELSPEGHFNHWLFDSLWQLLSISGERAITLTDEWGKKWMEGKEEGKKERTVCSAWKWKFGVGRIENKNAVWVAGGGYCICADEPEMTFACRRYRNRSFQSVGMNVQGGGKCQSICSSVRFRMSGRLKSELRVSRCAITFISETTFIENI